MEFKLQGMNELLNRLNKVSNNVGNVKESALDSGAEHLRFKISSNTARSGYNKKHAADNVIVQKKNGEREIGYSADHYYMRFQELGTKYITPNPQMTITFENEKEAVQRKMAEVIKRELGI